MAADDLIAELRREPWRTGLFLDVDGVLAPIVERPEDARVPDETREELRRLAQRYALVACVSGRTSAVAREIVGVDELTYVGEHGLELEPQSALWRDRLREFAQSVDWPVEDKGVTVSFHYRTVRDEAAAETALELVAERARAVGLVPRWGRKVLELRPPVEAHKGTAVRHLLASHSLTRALYAGDDTTDLDAFESLAGLDTAVRVAVASDEAPAGLREASDIVVGSPHEFLDLLRAL